MQTIDIKRAGDVFVTVKPDETSTQAKQVMGDNQVTLTFSDNHFIQFKVGDYTEIFGEVYKLNRLPGYTKESRFLHRYTLVLQASGYDLAKVQYLFLDAENELTVPDFSLMGNAETFVDLIIRNAARGGITWTKGEVIPTSYKNISFAKENCYQALSRLAEEFATEYWLDGTTINLAPRYRDTGLEFRHGQNKGLYDITRLNVNDGAIVTRLYAYGADKNLPSDYPGSRLRLPGYYPFTVTSVTCDAIMTVDTTSIFQFLFTPPSSSGATGVRIEYRVVGTTSIVGAQLVSLAGGSIEVQNNNNEFRFITQGGAGQGYATPWLAVGAVFSDPVFVKSAFAYLEKNSDKYGIVEYTETFDDIFPNRVGKVSSVNAVDPFVFADASMDFDLNSYLSPGVAAKVTFNTGQLAGYTFPISLYNNSLKQFRILKNQDEVSLDAPSNPIRPSIGDEYVLVDMRMPQKYVEAAETLLKGKATALLDQISQPQLTYKVSVDPVYLRRKNISLTIGQLVWIVDSDLELQRKIRIVACTRNLVEEFKYDIELSDIVSPGTISLIISGQQSNTRDLANLGAAFTNNSILNNNVIGDLHVKGGTIDFDALPTTDTEVGFAHILIDPISGKLYKKV